MSSGWTSARPVVATSPLDVLTEYLTRRWAGRMVDVIGSGTSLDTWRLRGNFPRSAAYIRARCTRGSWASTATPRCCCSVRQQSPASHKEFARQTGIDLSAERRAIAETVRTAAYRVRELKGSTWDAIGLAVAALGAQHRPRPRPNRSRFGPRRRSALRQLAMRARSRGCGQATSPEDGRAGGRCLGTKPRGATSGFDSAPMMSTVTVRSDRRRR